MINYSCFGFAIASSIILITSWLIYRWLFEAKIKPSINRIILIVLYGFSLIIPLLSPLFKIFQTDNNIEIGQLSLAVTTFKPSESVFLAPESFRVISFLGNIYFAGVIVMVFITFISLYKLLLLKKKACKLRMNGQDVYIHDNKNLSSFSWFRTIFLYENSITHDTHILLEHEKAHIDSNHWIDLMISQIFLIFQWFNPVAWKMRKELQEMHEFEADEKVLKKGYEEKYYQMLLLRNISDNNYPYFSNGFNNCSAKKRFLMMNRKNFKNNWIIRSLALCLAVMLGGSLLHLPIVASVTENQIKNTSTKNSHGLIKVNNVEAIKKPSYEGGDQKLNRDLSMRIRYPFEAFQNDIQGTVIVKFTVTKSGEVTDFRIENSVNIDLDIAAINAVKDLPGKWIPGEIEGMKVDLPLTIPVSFKLHKAEL